MGNRDTRDMPTSRETPREVKLWAKGKFEVVDTKLKSVGRSIDEIRNTANAAKDGSASALDSVEDFDSELTKLKKETSEKHVCLHNDTLTNIRVDVNSWTNWWKKTMFTLIGAIVAGAGAIVTWLVLHNSLSTDVELMQEDVDQLNKSVETLVESQSAIQTAFEKEEKSRESERAERIEEVKEALEAVLDKETKPKKRKKP